MEIDEKTDEKIVVSQLEPGKSGCDLTEEYDTEEDLPGDIQQNDIVGNMMYCYSDAIARNKQYIATDIDLYIFRNKGDKCNWTKDEPIKSCLPLQRLVSALSYYSSLRRDDLSNSFDDFINEFYNVQLLEDYAHLVDEHSDNDHLYAINQIMKKENDCSVKTCLFSLRHYRCDEMIDDQKIEENKLKFYAEIMDSCHFQFYHLFECGMRVKMQKKKHNDFGKMIKISNEKRKLTQIFDRLSVGNKFNLFNNEQINHSNTTFLDEASVRVNNKAFTNFLFEEVFDSDCIEVDIEHKANIFTLLGREGAIDCLEKFLSNVKRRKNTFSIGYRFHYWPANENYEQNNFGIKICDLIVANKFGNFKSEILAYNHITREEYEGTMTKALELQKTEKMKSTKHRSYHFTNQLSDGACIGLWHLIAIILYTDFSDHSADFSASFRSLTPFETLDETKKRNANFYWMARYLREAVEVFGKCRYDGVKGPFYCGINRKMIIPEFNLRLCAPTSTTRQIGVALKFAGSDGTIVQLNNDSGGWTDQLKAFDVSFLSRYPSEDERLFIGGRHRVRVETIRLVKSNENFIHFMQPLYYFDGMITRASMSELQRFIDKTGRNTITHLLDYKIGKNINKKMAPYIYEMFDAYCANKKKIDILFSTLKDSIGFMRNLLLYSYEESSDLRQGKDKTNLIRDVLAKIFPNVRVVHISAFGHSFSLLRFLDILKASNWQKVKIFDYDNGWLFNLWESSQMLAIEKEYKSIGYKIAVDRSETMRMFMYIEQM